MPSRRSKGGKRVTGSPKSPHVYVPVSFDPDTHLPHDLRRHADAARYFLHRVIWGKVQRHLTLDGYVPVKFDHLREVIPDRVIRPLKRALLDAGVVGCDGYYTKHLKSLGYRLLPPHDTARIVRTPLADGRVVERVRAHRRAEQRKIRLDIHKHLRDHYRRLEVDLPLALKLLAGHKDFEVAAVPARQIAAKEFTFSVCRYGRVHTDLTRCSKKVRPALRLAGRPLVEIDVANSQPLFLSVLIINFRRHGDRTFAYVTFPDGANKNPYEQVDEIVQRTISYFSQEEQSPTPSCSSITTRKSGAQRTESQSTNYVDAQTDGGSPTGGWRELLNPDEVAFVQQCEEGRLYDGFMSRLGVNDRALVKEQFFEVVYGGNGVRTPLKSDLAKTFPGVAEMIRAHKKKDHAFLSRLMQAVESNFVVNTVCRRLMDEAPDAPVVTIHDSLLTTDDHVGLVTGVMREEFSRLGVRPTLHVRDYGRCRNQLGRPESTSEVS